MKEKAKTYSSRPAPVGYVCVGYGVYDHLTDVLGIVSTDLFQGTTQTIGEKNWNGNDPDSLYYVTQKTWNKIFPDGTKKSYEDIHKTLVEYMGLKVGDKVKITHKVSSHYFGWDNSWVHQMDEHVGKTFTVQKIYDTSISLGNSGGWSWPITCMEKAKFEPITLKLTSDYNAIIQEDGSVKVGCQTIPFDKLEEVYNAAKAQQ